jgi:O-antigen/teichoic acid export membrane protein
MPMLRNDFFRKFMSNSVAQGLNFGSRWLLNLSLARFLLEQDFGTFSYLYMLANLFFPAIAFGASFYLINQTAKQAQFRHLLQSVLVSLLVFLVLTAMTISSLWWRHETLPWSWYLLSLLIGLCWALNQACFSYLKGLQQFMPEVRSQLLSVAATLVLVVLIWQGQFHDIGAMLAAILLVSLLPGFTIWRELSGHYRLWRAEKQPLQIWHWSNWRPRFSYAWHDVFAIYLTNIPFVFLAMYASLTSLGQFRKAFVLFMPITLLPVIFSQVLLAKLSAQPQLADKSALFRKVLLITLPLLSLPYLMAYLLNPWLYPLLLNEPLNPLMQQVSELVLLTLWLTLLKTYFEVWVTALGFNHWRASNVTVVALLGSLVYVWVGDDLTSVNAALVFLGSNLLAVLALMLLSLLAWRRLQRGSGQRAG